MNKYDIAIIGGGAAGIMAAIFAGKSGKNIILIERNDTLGKKLLATGNGRCNLTNMKANSSHYHGGSPAFIDKVLDKFCANKTIEYFESLGLMLKEETNGRIFPKTNSSESVLNVLFEELKNFKVDVIYKSLARGITKNGNFFIKLDNNKIIEAQKIIMTTGGKAAHQFGSSGDGYYWAEKFGHTIIATYPALVPIEIKENWIKSAQGIKIEGNITLTMKGRVMSQSFGDILFTHFGLSGPAAMSQGRLISANINLNPKISLDIFPEIELNILDDKVKSIISTNGKKTIKNCLSGIVPQKLAEIIIQNKNINPDKKSAEISKLDRLNIIKTLKNIELTPTKTRPFKESQVTSGGINTAEINPETMESKKTPGLFFAGEIIDVDGDSGGYNLQWAWSSGYLAGISASK